MSEATEELAMDFVDRLHEMNDDVDSEFATYVEEVLLAHEPGGDGVAVTFLNPKDGLRYRAEFTVSHR